MGKRGSSGNRPDSPSCREVCPHLFTMILTILINNRIRKTKEMAGETTDQGAALPQSHLIYLSLGVLPVVMSGTTDGD